MVASLDVAARCLLLGAACLPQRAPRSGGAVMAVPAGYLVRTLKPTQTIGLLASWEKHSKDIRAAGFRGPGDEAVGERQLKLKQLAEELPRLKSASMILGLCEKGQLTFQTLQEPHRAQAEVLSRTTLEAAISAGRGSAIGFVSWWDGYISIDAIAINPQYLVMGEEAEIMLLEGIVARARAEGISDVRLQPSYQVEGHSFYERANFFAGADGVNTLRHVVSAP